MKHHHNLDLEIELPENARRIVLAGNPNTGKSVFFNALTGLYVDVSNYPGTTLEIAHSRLGDDVLIDTPGVYGISSFNDEERIARDIILAADVVVNVVNAVHLERDLFLTQQIIDTGVPVVVALNMVDEAAAHEIEIDVETLSAMLGVPVIPTVAVKKQGFDEVRAALSRPAVGPETETPPTRQPRPGCSKCGGELPCKMTGLSAGSRPGREKGAAAAAAAGNVTPGLEDRLLEMQNRVGEQGDALLILEGDAAVAERHGVEPGEDREEIYRLRRRRVNELVAAVVRVPARESKFGATLGHWMLRPLTGIPILLLTLYVMYQAIGVFIAQTVVDFTEDEIMGGLYEPAVSGLVGRFISPESVLGVILIGEFGVLTMTVVYILGLLLPLIAGFYFFLALFEDSGYLPRIATLADRVLTGIGLNGKAIIPFILGFGCVTMATITTRMLNTDRERRIAIFLLGLTIPCSAQLAVIAGMLAGLGAAYLTLYVLVILIVFVVVGTVLNTVFRGSSTHLLIDLPPLRVPRLGNVLKKTGNKALGFLKEATPLFIIGAVLISTLQLTGALAAIQRGVAPVTVGWLNLPMEAATAFIMGIVRRDFGAAGLLTLELTALQTVVALITITLFVPCIASVFIIFKERSWKDGALIWGSTWLIAFTVGGTVMQLGRVFTFDGTTNVALVVAAFAAIGGVIVGTCKLIKRAGDAAAAPGAAGADS